MFFAQRRRCRAGAARASRRVSNAFLLQLGARTLSMLRLVLLPPLLSLARARACLAAPRAPLLCAPPKSASPTAPPPPITVLTTQSRTSKTPSPKTDITYDKVIGEVNAILQSFLNNAYISNLQALNAYYDATAMSAYAAACLVKIALLQQKVVLGAPDGSISEINALARSCGAWVQVCVEAGEERRQ